MKTLVLRRVATGDKGTFGCILYLDIPFALTLELRWLNNRRRKSCIPAGNYKCNRVDSPKFGNTFEITNVPGRSHILFHKGNLDEDSLGCVLVGEQFGNLGDDSGILSSKAGFNELMGIMKNEISFRLIIVDDW
ncbi:MAG: DUF5675 family protein, partial [Chloroflexota bacterium]